MKQSNNDNYDLNTSSPNGQAGFEPFRTDKHYYFHFNDANGESILFSQAYKTKKGCDNGMVSVKKNVKKKEHLLLHHEDGLYYFSIKAGNNQEVARSRNYESKSEMESSIQYLCQQLGATYHPTLKNENDQQIIRQLKTKLSEQESLEIELRERLWELETALAETSSSLNIHLLQKEEWMAEKTNLENKMVNLTKKLSDKESRDKTILESKEVLETIPATNFSFHVDFYNIDNSQDVKMAIHHPISKDKKIIEGFDKAAMIEFMLDKLPSTLLPSVEESTEREFDETKITQTRRISRNPLHTTSTSTEAIFLEKENFIPEKVKTIQQKKADIEDSKMSETLADNSITIKPENMYPTNLMDENEIAIIEQFFSKELKESSAVEQTIEEKLASIANSPQTEIILDEQEEKNILQFFPKAASTIIDNPEPIVAPLQFLDAFIKKNRGKGDSSVNEITEQRTDTPIQIDTKEEVAKIEKFFPTLSQVEDESAEALTLEQAFSTASSEKVEISAEETAIINKFFMPAPKSGNNQNVIAQTSEAEWKSKMLNANVNEEDIRLFNKFFGKNVPIGPKNSCRR